jgi:hypothetical protein
LVARGAKSQCRQWRGSAGFVGQRHRKWRAGLFGIFGSGSCVIIFVFVVVFFFFFVVIFIFFVAI